MHSIQELKITDDFTSVVEIIGSDEATECVVFSHGFGVRRDARGLFTDIVAKLSDRFLCVQFEYTVMDGEENWVDSYTQMPATLKKVLGMLEDHHQFQSVHVVGHSMGCILAAGESTHFHKQLYLAPPTEPLADRLEQYFKDKPGSSVNADGNVVAERSDGGITYINKRFFNELRPIIPTDQYAMTNGDITVIQAVDDEVITNQPQLWSRFGHFYVESTRGNHDFSPPDREVLVDMVVDYFDHE